MSLITSFLCLHCTSRSRPNGGTLEPLDIRLSMFHPLSKLAINPPWLMHLISLIVPLLPLHRLLKKHSKPTSSSLVAKNGTTLQSDSDKLNRWAEHFNEVVNCQVNVDPVSLDDLPVISPSSDSVVPSPSADDISAPLSEDEIRQAISELRSGRAPGSDGISLEMLNLGGKSPFVG